MITPTGIQLSRKKGWNLQAVSVALNGLPAVNVARPSKWGNPFKVGRDGSAAVCVLRYQGYLHTDEVGRELVCQHIAELRGKNLACWCPLGSACHRDVLLRIANE
jgi:hypothetical protein